MTFISYAQNFEDVILWRALGDVSSGRYIDIGAQDPVVDSVSKAFYDAGWRGVHVEPSPHYAQALRDARPGDTILEAAAGSAAGSLSFFEVAGSGLSTACPEVADFHRAHHGHNPTEIMVQGVTLDTIFEEVGDETVHWLKVDVEGFEGEVLKGWRHSQRRPWIVVIESTFPTTDQPMFEDWEGLIQSKGYTLAYADGLNRYYLHDSQSVLTEKFRYPPNVFDNFQLSGTATSLTAHLAWRHELAVQAVEQEKADLLAALEKMTVERDDARQSLQEFSSERSLVVAEALGQLHTILAASADVGQSAIHSLLQLGEQVSGRVDALHALLEQGQLRVAQIIDGASLAQTTAIDALSLEILSVRQNYELRLAEAKTRDQAAFDALHLAQQQDKAAQAQCLENICNLAQEVLDDMAGRGAWLSVRRRQHLSAILGQITMLAAERATGNSQA